MSAHLRTALTECGFDRVDRADETFGGIARRHERLHGHEGLVSQLQGDQVEHAPDFRPCLEEGPHFLHRQRIHALPDQHGFDLNGAEHGDHDQQDTGGHRADRIPDRIASRDREQRQDQAQQRGRIFTEDHPQLCLTIEQPKGCM